MPISFFRSKTIQLLSPLDGEITSLDDVPDPVFADRLLGEGIAIRPERGEVFAPADGVIGALPPTGHAIPVTIGGKYELLIHVGLETVGLGGKYFQPHCAEGDSVRAGQLLLSFDLDAIRNAGYEIITPVVIPDITWKLLKKTGTVRAGEPLAEFSPAAK